MASYACERIGKDLSEEKLNDLRVISLFTGIGGMDMGFDGKSLVHPDQLPYSNDAYTPKMTEVDLAREIIKALAEANASGRGTVVVNDRFIEHHHANAAKRLLMLHDMITEIENE